MGTDPGPAVVLITGVMASGKSTVAELLAGQLPRAADVRGDVFRRMVVSGREELSPEETTEARAQLDLRYRLSALVANEYAHHGWITVVQDINLGDDLTRYVARVHTRPLLVVVLAPSITVVRAREAARPKAGYGAWTVEALDHALRAETPRIGLWLDTSEHTPALTI
ncbi:AAA family ATPase [Streptomyces aurantiacus]|uniref:AAA family ATPase n=1 Tax=Streptomyces aurantiacus TaxID=47760 RepID=UPI0027D8E377|nr:AAA family ATPase [Streptomyces aurantiacus]